MAVWGERTLWVRPVRMASCSCLQLYNLCAGGAGGSQVTALLVSYAMAQCLHLPLDEGCYILVTG